MGFESGRDPILDARGGKGNKSGEGREVRGRGNGLLIDGLMYTPTWGNGQNRFRQRKRGGGEREEKASNLDEGCTP